MYLKFSSVVALIATLNPQAARAYTRNISALLDSANLSPETQVFFPSDPSWTSETVRWTIHDSPSYIAAVRPATEFDVQKLVILASKYKIPFLATGGGHGFSTTYGALQAGMEIDLGLFRNVSVDASANTVTVGGGTRFEDVYDPIYQAGKEISTGSDPCPGLVGVALGGGVGRYSGLHGMILDSLLSVRLVTATGDIVTASTTENPDLFWAIRGAGFNYGIVVEATFRVYDLTSNLVTNADLLLPLNASSQILQYLKSFEDDMPDKLAIIVYAHYSTTYKQLVFDINAVYAGPEDELQTLLAPLLNINQIPPLNQSIVVVPWNKLVYSGFFGALNVPSICETVNGVNANVYGGSVNKYNISSFVAFFEELQAFYYNYPEAQSSIFFIEHFGKAVTMSVPRNETAYPWRNITAQLLWNFIYPPGSKLEQAANDFCQKTRSSLQSTSGFNPPEVYINYAHGDESPETVYGAEKLPKLRQQKETWDPENLFRFNLPLY